MTFWVDEMADDEVRARVLLGTHSPRPPKTLGLLQRGLDVGYADTIPDAIRKAVIARDKGCAWPGGCNRRPASCDVHHVKHKKHGGKTSTSDCVMLCQYHHDICIHRQGWKFELLPDGSTRAASPDGQVVLRSHGPPPRAQPTG